MVHPPVDQEGRAALLPRSRQRIATAATIRFFDKVDTKFEGWTEEQFRQGGFRVVPPAPPPARVPSSPRTPC
jgi:hypothetical protein